MFKHLAYLLFFFNLWFCPMAGGQSYRYNTYDITTADGLFSNRISTIYQDTEGFIWLRTLEGIGRYDGHQFRWFTKANSNLKVVPSPDPVVEDAEGFLWLSDGNHVDLMDRNTFEVIPLADKFPEGLPFQFPIDQLWSGQEGSLYIKSLATDSLYHYHPTTGFSSIPQLWGAAYLVSKKEGLWARFDLSEWRKYDSQNYTVLKSFQTEQNLANWLGDYRIEEDWFSYYEESEGVFLLLQILPEGPKEIMRIPLTEEPGDLKTIFVYNPVQDQLIFNHPYADHSLSIVDPFEQRIIPVRATVDPQGTDFLPIVFTDQKGIYWQRSSQGLRLLQITEPIFSQYASGRASRGLWANQDHLVIQFRQLSLDQPEQIQQIPGLEKIQCSFTTEKEALWLGGVYGIYQVDPTNFSILEHIPVAGGKNMWAIHRDQENRWWGGRMKFGLVCKSPTDTILKPYTQLNGFDLLAQSSVIQILEAGAHLWAVTNSGLYLVHKDRGVVQRYWSGAETDQRLPFDDVHALYLDAQGVFWAATNADGLVRFELDDNFAVRQYQQYTTDDNLSSNVLYAIFEDQRERLWISTLNGISCFDKKTEEVQLYLQEDGLAELEFNRISAFQDQLGRIYFGSVNGVISFDPNQVGESATYDMSLHATDLLLYNDAGKVQVDTSISSQSEIVLAPDHRLFRLNVSLLDYFDSDQLRYSYRIAGLFNDYQTIEGNIIEIGGLPYGQYSLHIRGQSADKRYSTQELVLPLRVNSPFYYHWWFILLSIGLVAAGAYLWYHWRIRRLNERKRQLELLVAKRTKQIQKDKTTIEEQAAQLRELDQLKSRFFANISHELRTPLALILAPLEGILKRNGQTNRDYTYLHLMQQNGRRLLKRIDELLDLSRLDAQKLTPNEVPIQLYPFLKTNLAVFEGTATLKSIQLLLDYDLNEHLCLLLDTDKVEKIISNYLSNALKFTPQGGQVTLTASKQGNRLFLLVSDTGIGLAPTDLERVFERFYQVKQPDQQIGSGIGLALCKELAKVLQGRVWVTSQEGQGSTFHLEIPLVESLTKVVTSERSAPVESEQLPPPVPVATTTLSPVLAGPSILIAEDNSDLRQYFTMLLGEKYQLSTVENGQEALDHLAAHGVPDLIISDIMMPVMDGIALLKAVKQNEHWCHIPMIILTARQSLEVKIKALRIGVDDYLTKPFREAELLARIENLIQVREARTLVKVEAVEVEEAAPAVPAVAISPADLRWLEELEGILLDNLANPKFKLSEAATILNLSYRRLQQKLKAITGLSPKRYQRSIKLAKARKLLKSGQVQTVSEVMYQLGFDNHHYFSKMYREEFGIMPSEEL